MSTALVLSHAEQRAATRATDALSVDLFSSLRQGRRRSPVQGRVLRSLRELAVQWWRFVGGRGFDVRALNESFSRPGSGVPRRGGNEIVLMADPTRADVAILGAGSGGELVAALLAKGSMSRPPMKVLVFEPNLVGGECPFLACIPSKVLLAQAQDPRATWADAVARRDEVTHERNDADHAVALRESGATLVRSRAMITGRGRVSADGIDYEVDHIVVATGAAAKHLESLDVPLGLWTSADALSATELPPSLVIVGGGPIGCELSEMFARFGSTVTVIESAGVLLKDVEPEISAAVQAHLESVGVCVLLSANLSGIVENDGGYTVEVEGREPIECARVLEAIGKVPRLDGIGLESLGLDPSEIAVDDVGRLCGLDRVWAVGDVTALAPYTHGANAQARVVAENIGGGTRSIRAAVMPRCVYTHPPVAAVGPTSSKAAEQCSLAVVRVSYADLARATTDGLAPGQLTMFADRSTGAVVGASGIGASMDEIISQITLAIEIGWPVSRLQHVVQPFPTISELVGLAYDRLATELEGPSATVRRS